MAAPAPLLARAFSLWHYTPSVPAAVIFTLIFGVLTGLHVWYLFRTRLWFCIPFAIGGIMEFIGYIARIICHYNMTTLGPYIAQSILLLIPPSLFAASLYMVLGRTMAGLGPKAEALSIIRVNWLTKLFVLGDVFSFLIQSSGAGLMAGSGDNMDLGSNIVIVGLVVQILFFGLFVVASVIFHRRWSRTLESDAAGDGWRRMLTMLYATSALILVRSVFRIVEYAMGFEGYPMVNEWMLYVFDSVLMAAVMLAFWYWYPDEIRRYRLAAAGSGVEMSLRGDAGYNA